MSFFIVCDIDHTLLTDGGDLLEANVRALAAARAAGATVALATARSYAGARPIHRALSLKTPLVVNNGTLVCDPGGALLHAHALEPQLAREVVALMQDTEHHWSFRTVTAAYLHPAFDTSRAPFDDPEHYRPTALERLAEALGEHDGLLTASLYGRGLRAFAQARDWRTMRLASDYYTPSHYNPLEAFSLMPEAASKANAVRWLRAYLGLAGAPTLCIGDSPADAGMFALGIGVAPANAAPLALEAADWVAPHCDAGAVAAALERFVLGAPSRS